MGTGINKLSDVMGESLLKEKLKSLDETRAIFAQYRADPTRSFDKLLESLLTLAKEDKKYKDAGPKGTLAVARTESTCSYCKKKGHFRSECFYDPANQAKGQKGKGGKKGDTVLTANSKGKGKGKGKDKGGKDWNQQKGKGWNNYDSWSSSSNQNPSGHYCYVCGDPNHSAGSCPKKATAAVQVAQNKSPEPATVVQGQLAGKTMSAISREDYVEFLKTKYGLSAGLSNHFGDLLKSCVVKALDSGASFHVSSSEGIQNATSVRLLEESFPIETAGGIENPELCATVPVKLGNVNSLKSIYLPDNPDLAALGKLVREDKMKFK